MQLDIVGFVVADAKVVNESTVGATYDKQNRPQD